METFTLPGTKVLEWKVYWVSSWVCCLQSVPDLEWSEPGVEMVKGHVGACSSRQVRAHHFWTLQYTVVANSCLALEIVKTPSFACLWKNNVLKCMVCEITYFSTTVIRLHLLLNYLIRAVGYEESRNGTGPENLTTEEIFSCDCSQARKAHESFTLSLTHGIWQPYLRHVDWYSKVTQPSPSSAESLFFEDLSEIEQKA